MGRCSIHGGRTSGVWLTLDRSSCLSGDDRVRRENDKVSAVTQPGGAPADKNETVRRDAGDLAGVDPGRKGVRYPIDSQEVLQVRGPAADPDDRIRIRRAADVLPPADHPPVVASGVRLDQDRRTYSWPWHRDVSGRRQTRRPALRGPHPRALVASEGRTALLAHQDRAVDVRRPRVPDVAVDARYQFL